MSAPTLWTRYRNAPLSEQFKMEWIAFGVVAVCWIWIVVILSFVGVIR